MTSPTEEERLAEHRLRMNVAGKIQMTAEEILGGQAQAGVPRPSFLKDDEDDGSVHVVSGS